MTHDASKRESRHHMAKLLQYHEDLSDVKRRIATFKLHLEEAVIKCAGKAEDGALQKKSSSKEERDHRYRLNKDSINAASSRESKRKLRNIEVECDRNFDADKDEQEIIERFCETVSKDYRTLTKHTFIDALKKEGCDDFGIKIIHDKIGYEKQLLDLKEVDIHFFLLNLFHF